MTRKEAVDFLEKCRWWFEPFTSEKEQWNEALDIAIEALMQEFTQDLISRQAAIKNAHFPMIDDAGYEVVRVDDILELPSAEPNTKCIAQIRIDRDNLEDLVNEKVNEIVNTMSESKAGEWIPVSEGLPEEHEWIGTKQFGTTISDKVHITFDVNGKRFVKTLSLQNGELSDYEKRTLDAFYTGWKMIAWMPLPEPYREDGEE